MRIAATISLALLAVAPMAHAQDRPPSGELHLQFLTGNANSAQFVERTTITTEGQTARTWILSVVPTGQAIRGFWRLQTLDCAARTVAYSGVFILSSEFVLRDEATEMAEPVHAVGPQTTDEAIANYLRTDAEVDLLYDPVGNIRAAWTQAQDIFRQ